MSLRTYLLTIMMLAVLSSGCSTVQQWLGAEECDCDPVEPCEVSTETIAHAVVTHQVEAAHQRAATEGEQLAQHAQPEHEDEADDPEEEALRRAEERAAEPIDPTLPDATVRFEGEDERESFADRHGIDVSDNAQVFRHRFTPDDRSAIAVHRPGEALELHDNDDGLVASLPLDEYDDTVVVDDSLPVAPVAVELVRDRVTQLQLVHAKTDDDGNTTYYMGIYKLIGPKIGTVFHSPIAVADEDDTVTPLAEVRYLYGMDARFIEWTSLEGDESKGESEHYQWNEWEGVYRIPNPPPTAPDS